MSNEFVMVPRDLLKNAADRLSDLGQSHISEPLFGRIHAQGAQPQGEPVALPARREINQPDDLLYAAQMLAISKNECDRLRAQLAERDALLREASTALEDAGAWVLPDKIDAALSASAEPNAPKYHRQPLGMDEAVRERLTLIAREAAISSAHRYNYMPTMPEDALGWQPHAWVLEAMRMVELAAPVERDERAAFEAKFSSAALVRRTRNGNYAYKHVESQWDGWQARAALERKP